VPPPPAYLKRQLKRQLSQVTFGLEEGQHPREQSYHIGQVGNEHLDCCSSLLQAEIELHLPLRQQASYLIRYLGPSGA